MSPPFTPEEIEEDIAVLGEWPDMRGTRDIDPNAPHPWKEDRDSTEPYPSVDSDR